MLLELVSPFCVSDVTGGPYHGMPSTVLIARWPPWRFAAVPGGHTPRAPAWKCIACAAGSSRPVVCTVTVASVPLSRTVASPTPSTWLSGTGARSLLSGMPGGTRFVAWVALVAVDGDSGSEEPNVSSAAAAPPATTTSAAAAIGQRRRPLRAAVGPPGSSPRPPAAPAATATGAGAPASPAGGAGGAAGAGGGGGRAGVARRRGGRRGGGGCGLRRRDAGGRRGYDRLSRRRANGCGRVPGERDLGRRARERGARGVRRQRGLGGP